VLNRFIKISDYGYQEEQWAKLSAKERATLIHKSKHADSVKDALRAHYHLTRLRGLEGAITAEQELRLVDLSDWYTSVYQPMDSEIKAIEEISGKSAAKLRRDLGKITEDMFGDAR
jgi:hypothetical protein